MNNYYNSLKDKNLLVGICGSLSILSLPSYLLTFKQYFKNVNVTMTYSAKKIFQEKTISYLVDNIYSDEFIANKNHVQIARENDIIIVFPATANILGLAANGIASNFLSSILIAFKHKVIFFPNMNLQMWENPFLQKNVEKLKDGGHFVYTPETRMSFELASQSFSNNIVLPSIDVVLNTIRNVHT